MKGTDAHCDGRLIPLVSVSNTDRIVLSKVNDCHIPVPAQKSIGLKYVLKGMERYFIGRQSFTIEQGQYWIMNNNQPYTISLKTPETSIGLCIFVDTDTLQDVHKNFTLPEEQLLDDPLLATGRHFDFDQAVTHGSIGGPVTDALARFTTHLDVGGEQLHFDHRDAIYLFGKCLLESQRIISRQVRGISAKKSTTRKELFARLNKARARIHETLDTPLDIQQIAREAALSEFHFFRTFKEAFGCSPHQYYLQQRLQLASELLKQKQSSIMEIALLTGFTELSAFSRAFKRQFKMPPVAYRKMAGCK